MRNAVQMVSGVDPVELGPTPREVVWQTGAMNLYRYGGGQGTRAEPILIVMSFVTRPAIFDLRPGMSLVETLVSKGFDVYLLDWGVAGPVESTYTVSDYTQNFLPRVIGLVRRDAGAERVTLLGYCLGGTMSLLAVAADPALPVSGVLLVATPIDFTAMGPISKVVRTGHIPIKRLLDDTGNVPPAVVSRAIKMVKPTGDVTTVLSLWDSLPDQQMLTAHRSLMTWASDHVPFPGTAASEFATVCMQRNELAGGTFPLRGRTVRLADVRCRVLSVFGTDDALVPPAAHSMLPELLPGADLEQLPVKTGHVGLFFGRQSRKAMSAMVTWLESSETTGPGGVGRP